VWSGITDNWTLDMCNENDFLSPVNVDTSFTITDSDLEGCKYFNTSDASSAAQAYITASGAGDGTLANIKYGLVGTYTADGSGARAGYYIQGGTNEGDDCDINAIAYDTYNTLTSLNFSELLP
jgi:hypothetical protein